MSRCQNCKFVEKFGSKYECHRYPPQFAVVECGWSTSKYYKYPHVHSWDWCGEFQEEEVKTYHV